MTSAIASTGTSDREIVVTRVFGAVEGLKQTLGRLCEHLARIKESER